MVCKMAPSGTPTGGTPTRGDGVTAILKAPRHGISKPLAPLPGQAGAWPYSQARSRSATTWSRADMPSCLNIRSARSVQCRARLVEKEDRRMFNHCRSMRPWRSPGIRIAFRCSARKVSRAASECRAGDFMMAHIFNTAILLAAAMQGVTMDRLDETFATGLETLVAQSQAILAASVSQYCKEVKEQSQGSAPIPVRWVISGKLAHVESLKGNASKEPLQFHREERSPFLPSCTRHRR